MISAWGPGELVTFGLAAPGPQAQASPIPANAMRDLFAEEPSWKALSLWQPWPSLMARGVVTIATLHRATDYRGPIAIHAARTLDLAGAPDDLCLAALGPNWRDGLPASAMVAVGELVNVVRASAVPQHRLTLADQAAGVFSTERYAWTFANLRALRRQIPMAGRQGLFNWRAPEDLHDRLGPVLDPIALTHAIGWGFTKARKYG